MSDSPLLQQFVFSRDINTLSLYIAAVPPPPSSPLHPPRRLPPDIFLWEIHGLFFRAVTPLGPLRASECGARPRPLTQTKQKALFSFLRSVSDSAGAGLITPGRVTLTSPQPEGEGGVKKKGEKGRGEGGVWSS